MRYLNPLLTLAICLTLFVTSVSQAVARGQMAGGQIVQLCADGEAVTVIMDAQGRPIDYQHRCPDCVGANAALLSADAAIAQVEPGNMPMDRPVPVFLSAQTPLGACARGPPVLI